MLWIAIAVAGVTLWGFAAVATSFLGATRALLYLPLAAGIFVFTAVELLSLVNLVTRTAFQILLAIAWVVLVILFRHLLRGSHLLVASLARVSRELWQTGHSITTWLLRCAVLVSVLGIAAAFIVALVYAPNNYDALAYHEPRILSWLQNANIGYFLTHNTHQLDIPPLGEYFGLVSYSIFSGDSLLNLIQFVCFFIVILLAIAAARNLLRNPVVVPATFALVASCQVALLESTTTQVDLVSALWVVLELSAVVIYASGELSRLDIVLISGATALLSATTKPTAFLLMLPVLGVLVWFELRNKTVPLAARWKTIVFSGIAVTVGSIIGLLPQSLRNLSWFGNLFGTHTYLLIENHSAAQTILGVLRIFFNNVGVSMGAISSGLSSFFSNMLNADWSSPDAVLNGHIAAITSMMGLSEDYARAPFQLFGGLLACILIFALVRNREPRLIPLSVVFLASILIVAWSIKWNMWTNRFYIPIFMLGAILGAVVLGYLHRRKETFVRVITGVLSATILISSLVGTTVVSTQPARSLVTLIETLPSFQRSSTYYGLRPELVTEYVPLISAISSVPDGGVVRIFANTVDPVYILWALANPDNRLIFHTSRATASQQNSSVADLTICLAECPDGSEGPAHILRP
ncbi:MAG: hypothetical protein F2808_04740 [Actinobacteria bacterium]|uniref:Unannotated protein n=1 Tax=freshwater metagenome TaxID=449393 RepID=A0A6J7FYX6_9ZZZZ|nr:hypothetical protein [Actinomycetota bacterium]